MRSTQPRRRARADRRDPRGAGRVHVPAPRSARSREVRARFALPERYLLWVGGLQHPDPAKHVAKLAATPRELPLVLVGSTSPWAHELPDVILTGPGLRRAPGGALHRARTRSSWPRRTRASACRPSRRSPAARRSSRARCRRCARCSTGASRSCRRGDLTALIAAAEAADAPGPAAARVDLAGRGARDLAGLRARAAARPERAPRGRAAAPRPAAAAGRRRRSRHSVGAAPRDHGGDRLQAGSSGRAPATSARGR